MRIRHIQVRGYRVLENASVDLKGLNVLIGPNGVGKSTFLDAFVLLSQGAQGQLHHAVSSRGGISRMHSFGREAAVGFTLRTDKVTWPHMPRQAEFRYSFDLAPVMNRYYRVSAEELVARRHGRRGETTVIGRRGDRADVSYPLPKGRRAIHNTLQPALDQLALATANKYPSGLTELVTWLWGIRSYAPVAMDERSPLRLPQTLQPTASFPDPSGNDLFSVLQNTRIENEACYERIIDVLQAAFPGFSKLDISPVGAGQVTLACRMGSFGPLFANELSAGTLRFLMLATLLLSPTAPPLILLDEPDASLHPELLRLLVELLVQAAERTQIIVATQSASLIRFLKPEHVIVMDTESDGVHLKRGDQLDLQRWLSEYTLDQLWQMGEIGGRP